jgi:hypothetical protein
VRGKHCDLNPLICDQAKLAFHGPDSKGKDGPLSILDFKLILLHYDFLFRNHTQLHHDMLINYSLPDQLNYLKLRKNKILIDITVDRPDNLRKRLKTLGMSSFSERGQVISGYLPINLLGELTNISGVKDVRASIPDRHLR